MLEHVEESYDVELHGEGRQTCIGPNQQRRVHSPARVPQAFLVQIHSHCRSSDSHPLQLTKHVSGATPDLEDAISRRELRPDRLESRDDGAISRSEPDMTFLDSDEVFVSAGIVGTVLWLDPAFYFKH